MNFYIKVVNGETVNHPMTEENLLEAYQLKEITDDFLSKNSLMRFERPEFPADTRVISQDGYEVCDNVVRLICSTETLSQDEKVDLWVRRPRNMALAQSDWSQMSDSPLSAEKKAEWAAYRQELRDMTEVYANIQDPSEIVPPEPPSK